MSRKRKGNIPPESEPWDYLVERDYDPHVELRREAEGRSRKPPRLPPITETPPPLLEPPVPPLVGEASPVPPVPPAPLSPGPNVPPVPPEVLPPPDKESRGTMRRRSTKHPWNEIFGEIARQCIDPKTRCVRVPTNESKLASDVLQWCEDTNKLQPAVSDMREAVKAICAALRKI